MKKVKLTAWLVMTAMLLSVFTGCGNGVETGSNDENVELTWYYLGDNYPESQEIYDAANKIIKEKIGATVNFQPIISGEYNQKLQLKSSAAEKFDLCFTSGWNFDYYDNAKKGAFLPADELIDKYAPKTKAMIDEKIWAGTKINGKIYAVPNYQISCVQLALIFKKELVDKYDLYDEIDAIEQFTDLTPLFKLIHENEPNIIPTGTSAQYGWYQVGNYYEKIGSSYVGVDQNLNVVDLSKGEMGEIEKEAYRISREWQQAGYYHPDAGVIKNTDGEKKAGKYFLLTDTYKPGAEEDLKRRYGYDVYIKNIGDAMLTNDGICGTMTAISRTSKHPEKAMEFIELINTDAELYNLLSFGIKDKHYEMVDEDSIRIFEETQYNTNQWALGCQFNSYKLEGQPKTVWEETIKMNEEAVPAALLGFRFDLDPIRTELANISTALAPYGTILGYGLSADWESLLEQRNADMAQDNQKVFEEIQRQVEEFKKANNK